MTGTMTWVGLDVHARSIHAAAIDSLTGELTRAKLTNLTRSRGSSRGQGRCGQRMRWADRVRFVSCRPGCGSRDRGDRPGKTPRARSDRVKTDRRDAELFARLLTAGSLTAIRVASAEVEAARELTRRHDQCRRDLMDARHRVSKMLLSRGIVYPKDNTWTVEHRKWLSRQQLGEPVSDLVFADLLAAVDGLSAARPRSSPRSQSSRPTSSGGRRSADSERSAGSIR